MEKKIYHQGHIMKKKTPEYRMVKQEDLWSKKILLFNRRVTKQDSGDKIEITMKTGSKYIGQVNDKNERSSFGRYYVI